MDRRFTRCVATILACWLIVLASGDDFNVCRIAIPLLPVDTPADTLPLDDPNTDFTRSDVRQSVHHAGSADAANPILLAWQEENHFSADLLVRCFHDPCPPSDPLRPLPFTCLRC
jgi:hypothetical protein